METPRKPGTSQILALNGQANAVPGFTSILFSRTNHFSFAAPDGYLVTRQYFLDGTGLRIGRVKSTGHRITLTEDDNASVLLPRAGALSLGIAGRVHNLPAGQVALMPPQTRQTEAQPDGSGGFVGDVVMLPQAALAALSRQIDARVRRADFNLLHGAAAGGFANYLAFMLAELGRHETAPGMTVLSNMAALLRDLLAEILVTTEASEHRGGRGLGLERERVRRAEDLIRVRAHGHLSTAELAGELGIGLRSLQLAFQRAHGESPRAYLLRVRLDLARMRLLTADPEQDSVTAIALDCGFTHLGRFAGAYRKVYGERPNETLLRRRKPIMRLESDVKKKSWSTIGQPA